MVEVDVCCIDVGFIYECNFGTWIGIDFSTLVAVVRLR